MGVLIPPGYAQVSMDFYRAGNARRWTCVLGLNPPTFTDPVVIADEVLTRITAANNPADESVVSNTITIGPFRATYMLEEGAVVGTGTDSTVGTASIATNLPPNCSLLVTKRSGVGGRKGRGRLFFPPMNLQEGIVDDRGVIGAASVTLYQGWWDNFLTGLTTSLLPPVILHSGVGLPAPVTGFVVEPLIATQRRRLRS